MKLALLIVRLINEAKRHHRIKTLHTHSVNAPLPPSVVDVQLHYSNIATHQKKSMFPVVMLAPPAIAPHPQQGGGARPTI